MNQSDQKLVKVKDEEILAMSLERPSAFEELVIRYQDAFLRTVQKVVNQRSEAEDIVQESFIKIYLNAPSFREVEGASFKSWAYKIVINTALTHYRKIKQRMKMIEYVDMSFCENCPDDRMDNLESELDMQILVSKILPKMPRHLRDVLRKYYLEDKPQKIIANEERVSVAAIKTRLFRAKKIFRKILDDDKKLCLINY